jgi:DNA-binding transcriptional MerR regulator
VTSIGVTSLGGTLDRRESMATDLTIEQLAAQAGMSVRNIRAHQARGLLDPPEVRLRVGYYGPEHVAQLKLISDLQADGFNLAGIKQLLACTREGDDSQGTTRRLRHFRETLAETAAAEPPQTLTLAELGRRFRVSPEDARRVLERAERLGILVPAGRDRVLARSPALLAIAERVVASGVSLDAALAVFEQIERHCDAVGDAFVGLFMTEVWQPFQAAGMPVERFAEIDAAIAALRPLAAEALQATFAPRMDSAIESAFGERVGGHGVPPAQ